MLAARLRTLPEAARLFLDTLAVCGRPMAPQLVHEACGLSGDERPLVGFAPLGALSSQQRVRRAGRAVPRSDPPHALCPGVARRRRAGSTARWRETLVARRADDPETLFEHYERRRRSRAGVGPGGARGEQGQRGAGVRSGGLLLSPRRWSSLRTRPTLSSGRQGLATALANAGRPADAAAVYLDASADAEPVQRIELQRRAAEQFLIGGHIDRGLDVIRTVLAARPDASGARAARRRWRRWSVRRAQLRWRGLDFVERAEDRVGADDLLRIDTCWSVVTGLMMVDNIRAADFQTRHLLLALDAGEPFRIARALAIEAIFRASRQQPEPAGRGAVRGTGPGDVRDDSITRMPSRSRRCRRAWAPCWSASGERRPSCATAR